MTVIERWECPAHGNAYAPVMTADETPRCGRRQCGLEIVKVEYVPASQLAGAVEAERAEIVTLLQELADAEPRLSEARIAILVAAKRIHERGR